MTTTQTIAWRDHTELGASLDESGIVGKPVLLDLSAPSCAGCMRLEREVYSDPEVISLIDRSVIPVRVTTDSDVPDEAISAIVGRHIFIWSPTVQLLSPKETLYHEFTGAPRHTRLDMGYTRVHHDVAGDLSPRAFIAQLELGLAKAALKDGRLDEAGERLQRVGREFTDDPAATDEMRYWERIAQSPDTLPDAQERTIAGMSPLAAAVHALCETLIRVPEDQLMVDWHGEPGPGAWCKYSDCLREIVYGTYQRLIDLALDVAELRDGDAPATTTPHRIVAQHQLAYRNLQGLLVGVPDEALDRAPFQSERTLRDHLVHCVTAEFWAHAPQIRHGLRCVRAGEPASALVATQTLDEHGAPPRPYGSLTALLTRYEDLHTALVAELGEITPSELDAPTIWWEDRPIELRFRLSRLGWHLRDHTAVAERILLAIGHRPTEMHRLSRQLFDALGQAEGAMVGAPGHFGELSDELTTFIRDRTGEIRALVP
jgi:hypothetical protein